VNGNTIDANGVKLTLDGNITGTGQLTIQDNSFSRKRSSRPTPIPAASRAADRFATLWMGVTPYAAAQFMT
jgi:hypothetical protein